MDASEVTSAFAALSQQTRLDVFRLLVKAGEKGMLAGEIGEELGVKQNTMSANLSVLLNAGLVRNSREGRAIRYFVDFAAMAGMLRFLMAECCGGEPERCQSIIDEVTCKPCTNPSSD